MKDTPRRAALSGPASGSGRCRSAGFGGGAHVPAGRAGVDGHDAAGVERSREARRVRRRALRLRRLQGSSEGGKGVRVRGAAGGNLLKPLNNGDENDIKQ